MENRRAGYSITARSRKREKNGLTSKKREEEQKETGKLKVAAQDPLLRRLVTVHILATAVSPDYYYTQGLKKPGVSRSARWLNTIQQANLSRIEDAEYLGLDFL